MFCSVFLIQRDIELILSCYFPIPVLAASPVLCLNLLPLTDCFGSPRNGLVCQGLDSCTSPQLQLSTGCGHTPNPERSLRRVWLPETSAGHLELLSFSELWKKLYHWALINWSTGSGPQLSSRLLDSMRNSLVDLESSLNHQVLTTPPDSWCLLSLACPKTPFCVGAAPVIFQQLPLFPSHYVFLLKFPFKGWFMRQGKGMTWLPPQFPSLCTSCAVPSELELSVQTSLFPCLELSLLFLTPLVCTGSRELFAA